MCLSSSWCLLSWAEGERLSILLSVRPSVLLLRQKDTLRHRINKKIHLQTTTTHIKVPLTVFGLKMLHRRRQQQDEQQEEEEEEAEQEDESPRHHPLVLLLLLLLHVDDPPSGTNRWWCGVYFCSRYAMVRLKTRAQTFFSSSLSDG